GTCKYISGGIYCLTPEAIDVLKDAMDNNIHRMRNYQRLLAEKGLKLTAFPFAKIVDVDHAEDIEKAEAFLRS
ncbi:MAG: NDP-sugar synthase, partial [Tannerellaceae bacterium]